MTAALSLAPLERSSGILPVPMRLVLCDWRLGDLRLRIAPAPRKPEPKKLSPGVPNFMSPSSPPPGAWLAVQNALRSFLCLPIGARLVSGDDEDIFSSVLASPKLQALVRDTGDDPAAYAPICAYALGIAKHKRFDMLEARHRESEAARDLFPDYGSRSAARSSGGGPRIHCAPTRCSGANRVEAAAVRWIDSRRDPVPLTAAFELETFWHDVREWAARKLRARLHAPWVAVSLADRRELLAARIAGRALSPEEATWLSLASGRQPEIQIDSTTSPDDAFAREYAAVYRVFFRARGACPVSDGSKGTKT